MQYDDLNENGCHMSPKDSMDTRRVEDWLPPQAIHDLPSLQRYLSRKILAEYDDNGREGSRRWPGKHKNVTTWIAIEGGKAIGWNENPSSGWSFPVISHEFKPENEADDTPKSPFNRT